MLINLPNDDKRNKWRIDPEPPPSKLIRPGDKQYEALLERAIALNEKTKAEGKNMASSMIPITVACSKHKANIDLINLLELDYVEDGETVLVEIMGIGDSGADTGVEISEVRQIIGDQKLSDASCLLKGATGTSYNIARNILSIVKENGAIVNIETRKVEDLVSHAE